MPVIQKLESALTRAFNDRLFLQPCASRWYFGAHHDDDDESEASTQKKRPPRIVGQRIVTSRQHIRAAPAARCLLFVSRDEISKRRASALIEPDIVVPAAAGAQLQSKRRDLAVLLLDTCVVVLGSGWQIDCVFEFSG